ncbi:MAG TPA: helix-turn-helix transcriptional regulator [Dermatophilaceae bacterium]|nr:helix-turn-helix transcriptional regulator [Dermatophilaceae bacterium]
MPESWFPEAPGVGAYIRARRELSRMSLRELARLSQVSNAYLSQVERGLHEPSLRVLRAVAGAMSIPLDELMHATSPRDPEAAGRRTNLEEAIRSEPRLSRSQQEALIAVYRSFLKEGTAATEGSHATGGTESSSPAGARAAPGS